MTLAERTILLLLEAAPNNCVSTSNLQLVCGVLSKRYRWNLETSPGRLGRILAGLVGLYVTHGSYGFRLDEGGRAELANMHRHQGAFCTKLRAVASTITTSSIGKRSCHATL